MTYLIAYGVAGLVFAACDAGWLTIMGPRLYRPVLGPLLADRIDLTAAAAFYLIFIAGIVFLAVAPALKEGHWRTAALNGLVLGVVAYGAYDLTNQATLKLWAVKLTVMDMAWGGVMTSAAAVVAYFAARRWG
jgi:uncharacterized membrane protein